MKKIVTPVFPLRIATMIVGRNQEGNMDTKRAIEILKNEIECINTDCERMECRMCPLVMSTDDILCALSMAIKALEDREI